LSTRWPILITTLKPVPPGTNDAMSVSGTFASAAGGMFVGGLMWISGALMNDGEWTTDWQFLPVCTIVGVLGSMLDSLLGATLQASYYDEGKVANQYGERICGRDVLDNQQVNIVSVAIITSLCFFSTSYI